MKKSLSYLWPLTKKLESEYSGSLEVTWINGRKVLDSLNANYSFGALQEVLDLGIAEVRADRDAPVLLLGLGGGSAIHLLRKKYHYYGKITAVEIDPAVIDIAYREFQLGEHEPLEIICTDALEFVKNSSKEFGLIIIDLFLDLDVPVQFFTADFWSDISALLSAEGKLLFNAGINSANEQEIDTLLKNECLGIEFRKKEDVYGSNTLLLGEKTEVVELYS
ncbi:spermidine synthase [Salinimicrobium sp. TH3]|uniref:spermidine synthase n=1 Tax=Salinimicrobium sp. TH3 TaxID=2997342 RepID=UPI002273217F|nr:fused MFS/spermidine synthase [Salinimicrobium sp. TH3]MCY2688590.1 fused MFS/spermidine synthase [Salinimicrobium sp. TH3]